MESIFSATLKYGRAAGLALAYDSILKVLNMVGCAVEKQGDSYLKFTWKFDSMVSGYNFVSMRVFFHPAVGCIAKLLE